MIYNHMVIGLSGVPEGEGGGWSPIQWVIIQVINKIRRLRARESNLLKHEYG